MFEKHIFLAQNDIVVVDRGFRDAIDTREGLGLNVALPPFLNSRQQFTTSEANESRRVTKVRWVVEAINVRVKQFKFWANTIQNSSILYLEQYLSIACAIINKYRPPIKTSTTEDILIVEKMNSLRKQKKKFEMVTSFIASTVLMMLSFLTFQFLDNHNLKKYLSKWQQINHTEILNEFLIPSEDEIVSNITLGTKIFL